MITDQTLNLDWNKMRLMPTIVQNNNSGEVLMLGYMNKTAYQETLKGKQVVFYSRSKQRLWLKGETSGNTLELVSISMDCDGDALLVKANPKGPTCHQGSNSCFNLQQKSNLSVLKDLQEIVSKTYAQPRDGSYTSELFKSGIARIAQKVGEEGVEVALASVTGTRKEIVSECADLLYHLLVLLRCCELNLDMVCDELTGRMKSKES